ncbi:hypothetical protein EV368DRAFT_66357 [Lentinula lateritia]|nr:hypothetical protein EV368DRAFT_66357 [Lentinula lateritia]
MSIPEITFDLFEQAVLPVVEDSSVEKAHQKLRERGILIDERWKEMNFCVGEQEQEQETKVEVEVDARAQSSESAPSEEQQNARDECLSHAFIFGMRKDLIDGNSKTRRLAVASTPQNFHLDWASASHFAAVLQEKYCALQESLPIDFNNAFHPSLYSDWRLAFIRCATEGWAGVVTHRDGTKRPAEDDPEKEAKKSKAT